MATTLSSEAVAAPGPLEAAPPPSPTPIGEIAEALRTITTHAELLALTDGDPFVRWGLGDPLTGRVLANDGAVAVERFGRRGRGLWVFPHSGGGEQSVRALLSALGPHVAEMGTHQELIDRDGLYSELWTGMCSITGFAAPVVC